MTTEETNGKEVLEKEGLKLLQDTSYPLIQKFREICPGTYKHSQALSGMVEVVSMSLGLDIDAMKVASLYHDIGKTFNPKFFTENQLQDENPHGDLDPWISYQFISRHISDSVMVLLNDKNFPRDIIEIISQHHGTTVVRYFFNKAGSKDASMYRYKGAKPKSVESAVLMIADHIEATARSKVQAGTFNPMEVIETTITTLIDDGQLDDVYMRLGDLKKIKEALGKELEGLYQKRVNYDTKKEEKTKD